MEQQPGQPASQTQTACVDANARSTDVCLPLRYGIQRWEALGTLANRREEARGPHVTGRDGKNVILWEAEG